LADAVRGHFKDCKLEDEHIDQAPPDELRERCKQLIRANRELLSERGELLTKRVSRPTQWIEKHQQEAAALW